MPEAKTGYAQVNGAELYYEVTGEGSTLVFVHAGICDMRMWDEQVSVFASDYQVLRYDMRGFGKSEPVAGTYSNVGDLKGLLDHLGVKKAVLVGCSMGGTTAMDFTLLHAEYVQALVMVGSNPTGFEYTDDPPPIWEELRKAWQDDRVERVSEMETQVWVTGNDRTPDQVSPQVRDKVYEMNLIALRNEKKGLGERETPQTDAINRLGEIAVPVLVVTGDKDDKELINMADVMSTQIQDARKVVIMDTAHIPNMEKPEVFNQHLAAFLRDVVG